MIRPATILLVDDDVGDTILTRTLLEKQKVHLKLRIEHEPVQALQTLKTQASEDPGSLPDLILLDINMPVMTGLELKKELLEEPRLRTIPVIFLTTSRANQDILQAYDLGANAFITKPVDLDSLRGVLSTLTDFWLSVVRLPPKI